MGIECYVDADFAGGWNIATSANADNIMSHTGFIITYANCPIYWASRLQIKIALSTAEAEYIAMSSALHKVIPLMTLMKELHTSFQCTLTNQTSSVKSMRIINTQLEWQHLIKSHLKLNILHLNAAIFAVMSKMDTLKLTIVQLKIKRLIC
jgi:hypothetical protein